MSVRLWSVLLQHNKVSVVHNLSFYQTLLPTFVVILATCLVKVFAVCTEASTESGGVGGESGAPVEGGSLAPESLSRKLCCGSSGGFPRLPQLPSPQEEQQRGTEAGGCTCHTEGQV